MTRPASVVEKSLAALIKEVSRKAAKALKKTTAGVLYSLRPCDFA
jgi:hypothetical protein